MKTVRRANFKYVRCYLLSYARRLEDFIKGYEGVSKSFGLAAWSENCKWYSTLPLGAVVSIL